MLTYPFKMAGLMLVDAVRPNLSARQRFIIHGAACIGLLLVAVALPRRK